MIAEDLVAREPWEHAHIDRFRRALVMLDVPDPDTLIADRLSGQGPFVATDPFMAPESFGAEPTPAVRRARRRGVAESSRRPPSPSGAEEPEPEPEAEPESRRAGAPPEGPHAAAAARERSRTSPSVPACPAPRRRRRRRAGGLDIDLTDVLAELQGHGSTPAPKPDAGAARPQPRRRVPGLSFGSLAAEPAPTRRGSSWRSRRPTSRWAWRTRRLPR